MPEERNREDFKLRSEEIQEVLSKPPAWIIRWGITLIFIFTFIIIILAFLIRYPDFVSAKVIVTTEKPTERIISRISGALDTIYIQNGDDVFSGQKLAVIRNTAEINDVYSLKKTIDTIPFSLHGFKFPIDSTSHLILGDIESAYIEFEKSFTEYELSTQLKPYDDQLESNRTSVMEIKNRLSDQIQQKKLLDQEYELKKIDFERNKTLFNKGIISQHEFENKKVEYIQMQKNISAMAIAISQLREAISTADQTLKNTSISKQEDATRYMTNLSQSYNALKKSLRDWEHQYVLSSSTNGSVSFQAFWGANQYVNSGDLVFSILPEDTSNLVGKLTVSSQNAGMINIGQKVLVKLDNFPYEQFGILIGKVKNIAISPNSEGSYYIYISLTNGTTTSYKRKLPFKQELMGNAEIITEDMSVAQRIFYKFKNIFS